MSSGFRRAYCFALTLGGLLLSAFASAQLPSPADGTGLRRIEHSRPVWTEFATDAGRVEPNRGLSRMVLVLTPSADKQQALRRFLESAQNRQSPQFHRWLTPAEFGTRFGAEDRDAEAVRQWLARSGFQVAPAAQSKLWVEFSGTAQQVEFAFHSELHYYQWRGKKYLANTTDIAIPAQFAAVSRGVVSLDNFGKRPPRLMQGTYKVQPNLTATGQTNVYYLSPGDFSAIYNTKGLLSSGYDGTGISIAVTAQSDIELTDVQAFRQIFVSSQPNDPNFVVSGPDPGLVDPVDLQEAQLDVEWAGGVAPGATINLIVAGSTDTTSGVDLAAAYAVDNRIAPILTYTYGACEALLTPTQNAFYNALWQQAAAEGITVLVATGDNGAAGCDSANSGTPSIHGPAVNGAATTPYNVAVGGTQFADTSNPSTYWGSNNSLFSSALGYIPEAAWNESCDPGQTLTATNCLFGTGNFSLLAGGGGASTLYTKPSWQAGAGVPADGARDVPDLALAAAASHDNIVYCNSTTGTPCQINGQGEVVGLTLVGGTSVSTPAMAGILALVEEKNGAFQGQINYLLYQLAQSHSCDSSNQTNPTAQNSCVFYDVTTGNNSVPCLGGSPDCSSQQTGTNGELAGNAAGPGYDLATGLGSVNATNLANFWDSVSLTTTQTTLQALPSSFLHGTQVTVSGTVSASSGSGTPSGILSLNAGSSGAAPDVLTLNGGAFSQSVSDLPGGSYTLSAHYSGDATFAASDSPGVAVTVTPEPTTTMVTVNGLQAGTANYGSSLNIVIAVAGNSGMGKPSGTVTLTDGTTTIGTYAMTADGRVSVPTGGSSGFSFAPGSHSLTASSSGDNSFQPSSSSSVVFTITKGAPFVVVGANSSNVPVGQSLGVHAVVSSTGAANATGTVQFTVDGAATGAPVPTQVGGLFGTQAQASSILTGLAGGPHVIGAIYDGSSDPNYSSVPSGNGPNEFAPTVTVGTSTGTSNTTTALTVTTAPMTLGDSGSFHVTTTPAAATGTVTLWDAVGPRSSPVNISGGSASIQVEWTQAGSFSVYAVYSGDASNAASSSPLRSFNVQPGTPQVSLAVQNPVGGSLQTSLNASVSGDLKNGTLASPTGFVEFWDAVNGGAPQLLAMLQLTGGPSGASLAGARVRLVNGIHSLHAHYRGDNNWSAADSATTGAPSFALSRTPALVSFKGGSPGTATVTVTPSGGFTGTVALSCPTGATFALAGYTCSFNPPQVNITDANPQSATLTLTPPTIAAVALAVVPPILTPPPTTFRPGLGLWIVVLALATWMCVVSRFLRRSRPVLAGTWARGCAAVLASLAIGCGGGSEGSSAGGGPVATTTTVAVQQASNQLRVTVSVNSSGETPSGTINLVVDGGTPLSGSVSAGVTTFSFQPSPLVGVHTLDARYLGDSRDQPSDSGEQTAVITGNTTIEVLGAGGGGNATTVLPINVN